MESNQTMDKYGQNIESVEQWEEMAKDYAESITNEYHTHRLKVIDSLIPDDLYQAGKVMFDFGCGDALHFPQFLANDCKISGIDISSNIIDIAKQNLIQKNFSPSLVKVGGVSELSDLADNSLDAILSFNVLAYLTNEEEKKFYQEASRLLKVGGYLIVTHSNHLFDMFSLNHYTVEFFMENFIKDQSHRSDLEDMITHSLKPEKITYNIRENPLSYQFKLAKYGFLEKKQEFINLHPLPPRLIPQPKSYPDTLSWAIEEKWKLMFLCSIYGSLSVKE